MKASQILSRRTERKVDFRPDTEPGSPDAQLRRLASLLNTNYLGPENDLEDEVFDYWIEYLYRKIFTSVSHDEYKATPPEVVEWLIAVHGVESDNFKNERNKRG